MSHLTLSSSTNPTCVDIPGTRYYEELHPSKYLFADIAYSAFGTLVGGRGDGTCPGGCTDRFFSLCSMGQCVMPTCADVSQYCLEPTKLGIGARIWCPQTCGCDDAFSPLIQIGVEKGCGTPCFFKREAQLKDSNCSDAPIESAKLMAYANQMIKQGTQWNLEDLISLGKDVRSMGCKALLQFPEDWAYVNKTMCEWSAEYKTLQNFCPVTCTCKGHEIGCPSACPGKA